MFTYCVVAILILFNGNVNTSWIAMLSSGLIAMFILVMEMLMLIRLMAIWILLIEMINVGWIAMLRYLFKLQC